MSRQLIESMFVQDQRQITLQSSIYKINYLLPAHSQTYAISANLSPARQAILHIDSAGKQIHRWQFEQQIGKFGMLVDNQVIVANVGNSSIDIINLESRQTTSVAYLFNLESADQIQIFTFSESRYFCVVEPPTINSNLFKLTYYNYANILTHHQPISEFEEEVNSHQMKIVKCNNQSSICWFDGRQLQQIELYLWQLRMDSSGLKHQISVPNTLANLYNMEDIELEIMNLWQNKQGEYTMICTTNQTNQFGPYTSQFILDLQMNTIRQSKYQLTHTIDDRLYNCSANVIQTFYLGRYSVFQTFLTEQPTKSIIFYVNNETQSVITCDLGFISSRNNYFMPGHDESLLITAQFDNLNVSQVNISRFKWAQMRQIGMLLLLGVNEDYDDDLLQQALQLLGYL